jgi:hypothetical protein
MTRRSPPRKVAYFEPVLPRLAPNTIIESTFEVGRRFRCTMRIDCGQLDPGAVIRPDPGEWHPRMPERLDEEELADWRAGRNAVYQFAALTVGARLAAAAHEPSIRALLYGGACGDRAPALRKENPGGGRPGLSRGRARGRTRSSRKSLTASPNDRPG